MTPDASDLPVEERRASSQEAIIRTDMRTQFMLEELKSMRTILSEKADASDLLDLKNNLEKQLSMAVTKHEFRPIERGFYAFVGLVLVAVIMALLAQVIIK